MTQDPAALKDRVKLAAEIAREAPENLREAAFKAAFDELSSAAHIDKGGERRRSRRAAEGTKGALEKDSSPKGPPGGAARKSAGPRVAGPRAAVLGLVSEGFFDQGRAVPAIREHLSSAKGRRYEPKRISTTVLRLLRDGILTRSPGSEGYLYRRAK
jgi:hypothetical protein